MTKLAVVTDATPRRKKAQPSIVQAIDMTERDVLVAMRSQLAKTLSAGPPDHTLAQLMTKLREVDKEIRAIDERDGEDDDTDDDSTEDEPFDPSSI